MTTAKLKPAVEVCLARKVSGIIATNTTISRSGLKTPDAALLGPGGLSGRPLAERSNEVISKIYRYSKGELPIIGVGGIFDANDAFAKITAGASLLQAYTGFIYCGPSFARDINSCLIKLLARNGFDSLDQAIGSGVS